jgi:Protein of unknown function (DUF3306)
MAEEKFVARWSRRKRAAAREAASSPAASGSGEVSQNDSAELAKPAPAPNDAPSLPPVDAIDGGTDIREFLAPGIPTALAWAALRRAWASDPAIRDFVGLAENAWDFNKPDQLPGFGTVSAEDVRRLLAHAEQPGSASAETPSSAAPDREDSPRAGAKDESAPEPEPLKDANQLAVAQSETIEAAPSPPSVPRHGGALPK